MNEPLPSAVALLPTVVAHAGTQPTPLPHWLVLILGVVGLWVVIGGGVAAVDRLLTRLSDR